MEYKINKKPKSEIELTVSFTADEIKAVLPQGAQKISEHLEIKGFRKGKVPFEIVMREVGAMKVYEHAAEILVSKSYTEILTKENIEVLRQPHVEFEKLAPENEFIYKAVVLTVPSVEIGDLKSVKVKDIHIEVSPAEVDKIIEEMKEYSALETLENRPAVNGDKVEINFNVYRDGVPIEGGQADKHSLILGKQTMIPGFEEKIVGMCAGEEKEFELAFPEKYHAKHLAGQKCVFKIKVNGVFKRTLPDADDNLAKTHGKENLAELKQTIEHNLKHEQEDKQNQRLELEIIEGALKKSKFGEIPDELVNQEIDRMISELKQNIGRQGMKYEDYLGHIKKDELALRLDLAAQALDRVKAALLTRAIYFQHKLTVSEEDIDAELSKLKELYAQNPQVMQTLNSPSYREMTQNTLANKKVMMYLKTEVQLEK